jgi:ribosomal protein S18 acetylase RimI-like enzyme
VKILSLHPKEIEPLAELTAAIPLLRRYGWDVADARKILKRALVDPSNDLIVAKEGRQIWGLAWIMKGGGFARSAYLRLIAVDARVRRRGVGRDLMKEAERRHLRPNGLILLATSTNKAARRFYERLGYRSVGSLRNYVRKGLREIIYFKPSFRSRLKKKS